MILMHSAFNAAGQRVGVMLSLAGRNVNLGGDFLSRPGIRDFVASRPARYWVTEFRDATRKVADWKDVMRGLRQAVRFQRAILK